MMALVMSSPTATLGSAFSDSPSSQVPLWRSSRSSGLAPPPSPYPQHVDPSPTDSNGTENTEIDEDSQEGITEDMSGSDSDSEQESDPKQELESGAEPIPTSRSTSPTASDRVIRIATDLPARSRANSDDAPSSVIHAPTGFVEFNQFPVPVGTARAIVTKQQRALNSPTTPDAAEGPDDKRMSVASPLNTNLPPSYNLDRPTPRAQTRQEAEDLGIPRQRAMSRLEGIPETIRPGNAAKDDKGGPQRNASVSPPQNMRSLNRAEQEALALRTALVECWTLCNTLASLSSNHRQRMFNLLASNGAQEHAWQSCWRLCQNLYETYNVPSSDALQTLELCRDFCQALFDVRHRGDEATDSVLRVSFEMNNHLYNTHDKNLPEAFHERTLDFFVTLCHRMMKQQTILAEETDSLLRVCWSLAEQLFNLRQASREARTPDEELLGSAVQSCWELCDLFREGWSQVRPESRSTPRANQPHFPRSVRGSNPSLCSAARPSSSLSSSSYHDATSLPPETPITIFDDTNSAASSPVSVSVPNILVLGPVNNNTGVSARGTNHDRWSSNASMLSGYSESVSSHRTSSTATASTEGSHILRLQYLILKAAMNAGFARASTRSLPAFIKSLTSDAFGPLSWQKQVFAHYKSLVEADVSLRAVNSLPSKRLTAKEVAKAVTWLTKDEKWIWIKDLFRFAFDFSIDDVGTRGHNVHLHV